MDHVRKLALSLSRTLFAYKGERLRIIEIRVISWCVLVLFILFQAMYTFPTNSRLNAFESSNALTKFPQ